MPIALRFSSEYPTGLLRVAVLAVIMGKTGEGKVLLGVGTGEEGEKRVREEPVGLANGRKLFSSNWHRGLRRGRRRIIFSH